MTPRELAARLSLIVIADPAATSGRSLLEIARHALAAGAPSIQLRCKLEPTRSIAELGHQLRAETSRFGALLFVNDRVDVALAVGADGGHLGDDDLPVQAARAITPPGFLLGRSVDIEAEVPSALASGADYLGAGPVRATRSKLDLGAPIGEEGVKRIVRAAGDVPVVAIGGIDAGMAGDVVRAGAAGVAVIGSVMGAADPGDAVRKILREVELARTNVSPR